MGLFGGGNKATSQDDNSINYDIDSRQDNRDLSTNSFAYDASVSSIDQTSIELNETTDFGAIKEAFGFATKAVDAMNGSSNASETALSTAFGFGGKTISELMGFGNKSISEAFGFGEKSSSDAFGFGEKSSSDAFGFGEKAIEDSVSFGQKSLSDSFEFGAEALDFQSNTAREAFSLVEDSQKSAFGLSSDAQKSAFGFTADSISKTLDAFGGVLNLNKAVNSEALQTVSDLSTNIATGGAVTTAQNMNKAMIAVAAVAVVAVIAVTLGKRK